MSVPAKLSPLNLEFRSSGTEQAYLHVFGVLLLKRPRQVGSPRLSDNMKVPRHLNEV